MLKTFTAALLATSALVGSALGQNAPVETSTITGPNNFPMTMSQVWVRPTGGPVQKLGDFLASPSFTGLVNTTNAAGYAINGFSFVQPGGLGSAGVPNNSYPGIGLTYNYDPARHSNAQNKIIWNLVTNTTSNNVNEVFDSTINASGTGTASAEINQFHALLENSSGVTLSDVEGFEASFDNTGTLGEWDGYLALPKNGLTGTIGFGYGFKASVSNVNTTASSFGTWAGFYCVAKAGGGTQPVADFCLLNADPAQNMVTAGKFKLGQSTDLSAPTAQFQFNTADVSSANLAILGNNSAGVHMILMRDDGAFNIGSATQGAPNAAFTVSDGAGNALGAHIGFLQTVTRPSISNATIDATAGDVSGNLTFTAAAPVLTYGHAFATAPHCVVALQAGTAITSYSASTTALTIVGGDATTRANYVCIQ